MAITTTLSGAQVNITIGGTGHYLRLCNAGGGYAYIWFYEASASPPTVTIANSVVMPPGAIEVFSVASDTTRVAALGDATGTTLNAVRGEGV